MAQKEKSFLESIADMGSKLLTPKPKKKPIIEEEDDGDLSKSVEKSIKKSTGGN